MEDRARRSVFRALRLLAPLAALEAARLAADGPNQVASGGFDISLSGWIAANPGVNGSVSWSTADAGGSPHSGSAKLVVTAVTAGALAESSGNCVPFTPGTPLVFGGSIWGEPATAGDQARVVVAFFNDTACGPLLQTFATSVVTTSGWNDAAGAVTYTNPAAKSARVRIRVQRSFTGPAGSAVAYFDNVFLRTGTCAPAAQQLCLADGRFQVTATWKVGPDQGSGNAVPFSSESGSFWFFSPTNLELDVKVLAACPLNNRFWVYAAGLTDVEVTLTVKDTKLNVTKTYHNPPNHTFSTITDSAAFATCP